MSDQDPKTPPDKAPPAAPKQSGRVTHDAKGNPVWEWETSTGVYDRNVTTQRLKKLEAKLSLEETQPVAKPKGLSVQEPERLPGGGMNPYDSSSNLRDEERAPVAHPALVHKQAKVNRPVSSSLASKYAAAAKKKAEIKPQSFWEKLKARFTGK
jgi:hypothetical protein